MEVFHWSLSVYHCQFVFYLSIYPSLVIIYMLYGHMLQLYIYIYIYAGYIPTQGIMTSEDFFKKIYLSLYL